MNSHILFGFVVIICQLFFLASAKEIITSEIYYKGSNLTSPVIFDHVGTLNITGDQKNIQINGELMLLKKGTYEWSIYKSKGDDHCSGTELKKLTSINSTKRYFQVENNESYSINDIVGKMIVIFGEKDELYHVPEDKRPKTTDKVIIACGTIDKVKSTTAAPPKPTATTEKPKSSSTLTQAQGLISLMSIGLCFLLNKF